MVAGEQFVKGKQERKPDQFGNLGERDDIKEADMPKNTSNFNSTCLI